MSHEDLFVSGKWITGYGKTLQSFDPATGEVVWEGSRASASDVDRAVKSARDALPSWVALSLQDRIKYLKAYQDALAADQESIALAISKETGKPLWESHTEVSAMMAKIDISISAYANRCTEITKTEGLSTRHKPHGVIAVFGPFNFPGHLPNGHIVPALLAGNTVVFKPSELTPMVAHHMIKCWEKAAIPSGVINLVQGAREVGEALANNQDIDGLFFTGSYGTGQKLAELFAKTPGKILALEMGGNNPLIVSDVNDLHAAAYHTVQSAYLTSGQRCTCARRLIIPQGKQGDDFLNVLQEMIKGITIGTYTDTPEPFMGPVINEASALRLLSTQAALQSRGGKPIIPLQHLQEKTGRITPGLIDVTDVSNRPDEEIFGPLLQVIRVPDFAAAIIEANNTRYGLSAGLFSDRKEEYDEFYHHIRAGIVNWNVPMTGASSSAPFGGIGCSGNFHPSAYYAADYCAYPVASMEAEKVAMPEKIPPGLPIGAQK